MLVAAIADGVTASAEQIRGLTEDEIREVERAQPAPLASDYRRFLELAGRGAGRFLQGSDVFYPAVLQLRPWAHALLKENAVKAALTDADRVIFMHQGYQFDFLRGGAAAPEVWSSHEVSLPEPTRNFPTFTDWLEAQVRHETEGWHR